MASTSRYYTDAIHGLSQTIEKRLNEFSSKLSTVQMSLSQAEEQAHQSVVQRQPILQNIEIIFQRLRNVKVDTSFSNAKTGDTLFDFIDSETVYSIQQDAICRIKEIEEVLSAHHHAVNRIIAINRFLSKENDICRAKQLEGSKETCTFGKTEYLIEVYNNFVACFLDIEQCDRFLLRYYTAISGVQTHYNHLLNEAETLFEELYSLCDFYRQFELAYANSLEELYRRQMFDKKTETTIQEMMCLLQRQVDDENSRRVEFNQEHFRYLPATLSPQLSILARRLGIVKVADTDE